ncbi:hypothetical protein Droror1_Dr00002262 [Drosera rotundifolia]
METNATIQREPKKIEDIAKEGSGLSAKEKKKKAATKAFLERLVEEVLSNDSKYHADTDGSDDLTPPMPKPKETTTTTKSKPKGLLKRTTRSQTSKSQSTTKPKSPPMLVPKLSVETDKDLPKATRKGAKTKKPIPIVSRDIQLGRYDVYAKFTWPMVDEIGPLALVKKYAQNQTLTTMRKLKEEEKKVVKLTKELNIVKLQVKKIQDISLPTSHNP